MFHEMCCTKHGRRFSEENFSAHLYSGPQGEYAVVEVNGLLDTAPCLTIALEGEALAYPQVPDPTILEDRTVEPIVINAKRPDPSAYVPANYKFVGTKEHNRILCIDPMYPAKQIVTCDCEGDGVEYTLRISKRNRMYLFNPGDPAEPGDKFVKFKILQ